MWIIHFFQFSVMHIYEASSDPTFCNRNTWRAMRVILKDVIAVGIGGSFLVFTGLITSCRSKGYRNSKGKATAFLWWLKKHSPYSGTMLDAFCVNIWFYLANVDPIDLARNITGLNPETNLAFPEVVSK
ncbi:unnamed protein product [Prunus brigantina]